MAACIKAGEVCIEKHEHFVKQTHRNRALIYGANGMLPLIIPIQHTNLSEIPIHEVRIANDSNWQKIHWRSIVSSYRNSAFFDYYEDDFSGFYLQSYEKIWDFNLGLLNMLFRILQVKVIITETATYEKAALTRTDLRNAFDQGNQESRNTKPLENRYRQVFSDKHGFIPNLSVIDLLFNEGPKSQESLALISQS